MEKLNRVPQQQNTLKQEEREFKLPTSVNVGPLTSISVANANDNRVEDLHIEHEEEINTISVDNKVSKTKYIDYLLLFLLVILFILRIARWLK